MIDADSSVNMATLDSLPMDEASRMGKDVGMKAYHGGDLDITNRQSNQGMLFVTQDKAQASAYAKGNGGKVHDIPLDNKNIVDGDDVVDVMADVGIGPKDTQWALEESQFFELLDPNFEQFIGHGNVKKLQQELSKRGIDGARFTDFDIVTESRKGIENIALFNWQK